ncbi:unnamed protein product [Brassica rapa subsp. narinosa]
METSDISLAINNIPIGNDDTFFNATKSESISDTWFLNREHMKLFYII